MSGVEPRDDDGPDDTPAVDRGVARRQAFLIAAREIFLNQGFEAASVNDVVRQAGGSLATLYAQFGSKEGLFLAVFEDQHARFTQDMLPPDIDHLPLEEGLQAIGEQFTTAILRQDNLAFFRIAIGGARSHPDLLQRYLVSGATRIRNKVADYFRTQAACGGPEIVDSELAASFFFDLLRSRHHYRAMADMSYSLSEEEVREHVRGAVRFLLNGALKR